MPAGRPSTFDPEIADKICERIATSELGLEQVLDEIRLTDGWAPSTTTVWRWMNANEEFRNQSVHARTIQSELLHDRAQIQAQTPLIGVIEKTVQTGSGDDSKTETTRTVSDNVERSKLIVQTTLKRAGQLNPKKYGERVQNEHSGPDGGAIQIVSTIPRPPKDQVL